LRQQSAARLFSLLQAISQEIPRNIQQRYAELHAKLLDETLSEGERNGLLSLVEITEKSDADRLKYLLKLAQLRSITLDALMDQLGIRRSVNIQAPVEQS
jgi:hypothetical protein